MVANVTNVKKVLRKRTNGQTVREKLRAHVGKRLRDARERAGMTLKDVAERVGITVGYLSDVELGRRSLPRPERLLQVAAAVSMPLDDLVELFRTAACLPPEVVKDLLQSQSMRCDVREVLQQALARAA